MAIQHLALLVMALENVGIAMVADNNKKIRNPNIGFLFYLPKIFIYKKFILTVA
jgi:hypothetical protein